jgi:hypothetical protein
VARDPAAGAMFELQGNREQLRRDRQTIERLLAEAGDGAMSVEGLGMIQSVGRSASSSRPGRAHPQQTELRALRYRYTDEHLPVQRLARGCDAREQYYPGAGAHAGRAARVA